MKRILIAACVLALLMAGCTPVLAAEAPSPSQEPVKSCYYPIAVDSYTSGPFDELRISKTYQLSIDDDPRGIPTEDFDSYGRHYFLVDMIRENDVGVDTKPHTETVTLVSDTNQMDAILKRLDVEMEFTADYTGEVSRINLSKTRYVAIFEGTPLKPQELKPSEDPSAKEPAVSVPFNWAYLLVPLGAVALIGGGVGVALFLKRRNENEEDAE